MNKQERTYTILGDRIHSGAFGPQARLNIDALARELGGGVGEEGVGGLERAHELAEELEADHAEQLRPRDQPADEHGPGHLGPDGVGHDRGLLAERRRQRR